jgi:hypothetical protein
MQRLILLLLSTGFVLIALIGNAVQALDVVRVSNRAAVADTAITGGQVDTSDVAFRNGQIIYGDTLVHSLPADTAGVSVTDGIDQQERELRSMQRVAEAGVVGESQDGIVPMEIDGLVVDETITRIGRDFYAEFYRLWQRPPGSLNYTVVVEEQPMPGMGTRILVRVNDELAFQTQLQPRLEMIEEAAWQGVGFTYRFVQSLSGRNAIVY